MKYTILRFLMINSKTKATRPAWVETISWGEGSSVKKVSFTYDREKAAHLSSITALKVAEQYFNRVITLEWQDGTPNVELTAQLLKTQLTKQINHAELTRKANAEMREFWAELVEAVPSLKSIVRMK